MQRRRTTFGIASPASCFPMQRPSSGPPPNTLMGNQMMAPVSCTLPAAKVCNPFAHLCGIFVHTHPLSLSLEGYLAVVLVLLERRANANVHDVDGWTPLHVAAYWDKTLIFEPLMTFGADLDLVNKDHETPLDVTENAETREKLEGEQSLSHLF